MSEIACLFGIIVIVVVFIIIVYASKSAPSSTQTRMQEPMVMPPPVQGRRPTPPPRPAGSGGMVVRARRAGIPPAGDSTLIGLPTNIPNAIHIPPTITIFRNQRTCKVCQGSISWSSQDTGWVRCMHSKMLVHGHCHTYIMRQHMDVRNWCTFCEGSCASGQAMRIEGRVI